MIFEFTSKPDFDFLWEFSAKFNISIQDNYLKFPKGKGEGYIRKVDFDDDFRLLVHRYNLNEDFVIVRNPSKSPNDLISIFFYNNEQPAELVYNKKNPVEFSSRNESAIQITTSDLNSIIRFPAHSETYYAVVGITARKLATYLKNVPPNNLLKTVTSGSASFLYFESMTLEIEKILKHLSIINATEPLSTFYLQIKVEELLYLLFKKLIKRENLSHKPINNADAEKIINLRDLILADLAKPPSLPKLAATTAMSETKMKQLFKQTFGDSIYNYYQKMRMKEAAFLLKQGGYAVSEVGFQLGFTNLSHFSRLFKKHYGITPKKYSSAG